MVASEFYRQTCLELAPGPCFFKFLNLPGHRFLGKEGSPHPGDVVEHVAFYLVLICVSSRFGPGHFTSGLQLCRRNASEVTPEGCRSLQEWDCCALAQAIPSTPEAAACGMVALCFDSAYFLSMK